MYLRTHPLIEMAETVDANLAVTPGDEPGLATAMQRKLDDEREENSRLRTQLDQASSKLCKVDDTIRAELKGRQPAMFEFLDTMKNDSEFVGDKDAFEDMETWAKGVHESKVPEAEKTLTRVMVCCSQRMKRMKGDEDASAQLRDVCASRDALQVENDGFKRRCGELEELCLSTNTSNDTLIRKIEELRGTTHNFSSRTSRESNGKDKMQVDSSPNPMARSQMPMGEWLQSLGSGCNSHTLKEGSSHAIYGSDVHGGASSSSISNIGAMISGMRSGA